MFQNLHSVPRLDYFEYSQLVKEAIEDRQELLDSIERHFFEGERNLGLPPPPDTACWDQRKWC